MSGYFQRLGQRSGLGEQPVMTALAKPEKHPTTEVETVREVLQPRVATNPNTHKPRDPDEPLDPHEPVSPSRRADHSVPRDKHAKDRGEEPVPRSEQTASSEPVPPRQTDEIGVEFPTIDTAIEQVDVPAFIRSEMASEVRLPDTNQVEKRTPADDKDVREQGVFKGAGSAQPAVTIPGFIRNVETIKEHEQVLVRSDDAPVIEPKGNHPEPATTPEFTQSTVSVEAAPRENTTPVEQFSQLEQESGPRIHIGHIQIEVYAAPSPVALQAVPKPAPRPSRSAKASTRSPDLRRYYLREF